MLSGVGIKRISTQNRENFTDHSKSAKLQSSLIFQIKKSNARTDQAQIRSSYCSWTVFSRRGYIPVAVSESLMPNLHAPCNCILKKVRKP